MEYQPNLGFPSKPPLSGNPGIEQGLRSLLQVADDLLFTLGGNGQILDCKANVGSQFVSCPLRLPLHIREILPLAVTKQFEAALDRLGEKNHFVWFDSVLVTPPDATDWYEFRLLPANDLQMFLFIWKAGSYKDARQNPSFKFIEKTIEGWARFLSLRHLETEDHTRRVTAMTLRLALRLGLPEDELNFIRYGAEVHDIGKILIPDSILLKADALTDDEWRIMKFHPLAAVELLEPIQKLGHELVIPRSHHERWDGAGYPDGLAGEDIPLAARIFAFADVYDALTSDRTYRPAWSRANALQYIRGQSGKHFDPFLAPEFLGMME